MELTHYSNPHQQNKCYQNVLQQSLVSLHTYPCTQLESLASCACTRTPVELCSYPVLHKVNSVLVVFSLSLCMNNVSGHVLVEFQNRIP